MAKAKNINTKEMTVIGQRVVIATAEGEMKATISGYPFKTKNFISVIYDGKDTKGNPFPPVKIDLDVYGEYVFSTRGRRPNDSYALEGATLVADNHKPAQEKVVKAAPVAAAAAPTRSRKAAEVATPAPVHQPRAKRPSEIARAAAKSETTAAKPAKGAGTGIANSGSGMLMKIAGSKAYALAKEPSEEGLADLLATIEAGFKAKLGIGAKPARKAREVAAVAPAPAAQPTRRRAAPAPVAPAPAAAKPVQRVKAVSVPQAPALRAPTIGRRPNPMA